MTKPYPLSGAGQPRTPRSWESRARRLVALGAMFAGPALAPAHATTPAVTFCKDVAPIVQANCQTCHHPGGIGPFSLMTYQAAKPYAPVIKFFTQSRVMPPWKAADGYGEFQDERRLTDDQIKTLAAWADSGAPEGNPKDLPPPRQFTDGWQLGTPDQVLDSGRPFDVPASGPDIYREFSFPINLKQDQWVAGIELLPGSPDVVHHATIFLDPLGKTAALLNPHGEPGFASSPAGPQFSPVALVDGWGPGATPHLVPPGCAWRFPAGSYLVVDVHYHPNGHARQDRTRMGLYFARGPVDKRVRFSLVGNTSAFTIPAGDPRCPITAARILPRAISILWVWPHMHLLGHEVKAMATLPGGIAVPMIWIPDWDFHWQMAYAYKEPLHLPTGTRIDVTAIYDNSANNPNNPNSPPIDVHDGPRSVDEMMLFEFPYTVDDEHLLQGLPVDSDGIGN